MTDNVSCKTISLKQKWQTLGLLTLKFMNFWSKWDLLSIVFHQIPNGGKMQFQPAILFDSYFAIFSYNDTKKVSLDS